MARTLTVEAVRCWSSRVLCVKCWPNRPDKELRERQAAEGPGLELRFVSDPTEIDFGTHSQVDGPLSWRGTIVPGEHAGRQV